LPAGAHPGAAPSGPVVSGASPAQGKVQIATIHQDPAAMGSPKALMKQPNMAPDKVTSRALAPPKPLGAQVVMERVPIDALAGPVAHPKKVTIKLVSAAHKPQKPAAQNSAQQPASPTPALRTAADSD